MRKLALALLLGLTLLAGAAWAGTSVPPNREVGATQLFDASGNPIGASDPLPVAQGTPAAVANAWPAYLAVGGAAISATNPLPIGFGSGVSLPPGGNLVGGVELYDGAGINKLGINASGEAAIQAPPSLPLPAGAATAANQAAVEGAVGAGTAPASMAVGGAVYNSTLPSLAAGQSAALQADALGRLLTDGSGVTQPISASALPLPAGAATAANQTAVEAATGSAVPASAIYNGADAGGLLTGKIACNATAIYDAATSGLTQLVALAAGKSIYICGYTLFAAGAVNVDLVSGTGTACATGTAKLTPAFEFTAQTGISDQSPEYRGLQSGAGNALCIDTSAAVAVQAIVYYDQM